MSVRQTLEDWLTIYEAVAWVQFRTTDAVAAAKTPDGLAALRIFRSAAPKGSMLDLRRELRGGRIVAKGQTKDGSWHSIDPHQWFSLPVAPTNIRRQQPYCAVIVERDVLLKLFPEEQISGRKGRPPSHNWPWVREAAEQEGPLSQHKLAEVLQARYEGEIGKTISLSALKRKLKAWGY